MHVLPHGCQDDFFEICNFREYIFPLCGDELIIGSVNSNSERKAVWQSILLHEELEKIGVPNYLYLHMNPFKQFNMIEFAKLYCSNPKKVFFPTEEFLKKQCTKSVLNNIYNSIDLYLSTSLGEGWGLTATEAAACGKPIAIPKHTAFKETYKEDECIFLPLGNEIYYCNDNRIAPTIDIKKSAQKIKENIPNFKKLGEAALKKISSKEYSWDHIAKQWLEVLK
jgi:glycosyltransferase involved in cell wall biosynthesis